MTNGEQPNQFDLEGDGARISYSVTSISGEPLFSYTDANYNVNRRGEEVRTLSTEICTLVTIDLERNPDAEAITFSLLVPGVNIRGGAQPVSVNTIGVITTDRSTVFAPQTVEGQVQLYRSLALKGTAQIVVSLRAAPA